MSGSDAPTARVHRVDAAGKFQVPDPAWNMPHRRNCHILEMAKSSKSDIQEIVQSSKWRNPAKSEIQEIVTSRKLRNPAKSEIQETVESRKSWNPANSEIQQKAKSRKS